MTGHLFVSAEYRGFAYDSPTYDLANLNGLRIAPIPQSDLIEEESPGKCLGFSACIERRF